MAKTLHYDFINDKSLVGRVGPTLSITRASSGTYFDASGVMQTASSNVARFDHDISTLDSLGLWSERESENTALWSEDVSNAVWVATNVTKGSNSVTTPRGVASTTVRLTASAANGTVLQSVTSASANRGYSVYMKRVTGTGNIQITLNGGSTWTTKTLTSSWQRFDVSGFAITNPQFGVRIVTSGDAIDFWGSQLETYASGGISASSYIFTEGSSASRAAETISTPNVNFYNALAGTFYTKASKRPNSATGYIYAATDGSNNDRWSQLVDSDADAWLFIATTGTGGASILTTGDEYANEMVVQTAAAMEQNDVAFYADGSLLGTDTSCDMPNGVNALTLGSLNGTSQFSGHLQEIRYYNERLENAVLADMSNGIFPAEPSGSPNLGLSFGKMGRMGAR